MENITDDNGSTSPTTLVQALSSVWNYHYEPNQLYPELANVMSLSPFDGTVSASRKQMFGASHTSQCLVIAKPTPRRIQTGAEIQYGRATFSTKVERDCRIMAMIPFYNTKMVGTEAIRHNPETVLIVEYQDDGEIDCISMKEYFSNHQYFGFPYKNTDAARNLRVPDPRTGLGGSDLLGGTILQDSPSKRPDGNYCYGINLNVMFASFPEVAEDGVLLSEEAVPWLKTRKYEKRTVSYGSTHFALNIYGDENNYKPFPEIGDYVRADGLLMALRSYSDAYSAVEMSAAASREVNYVFDKLTYVTPAHEEGMALGRGRVIDIRVSHDVSRTPFAPNICNEQALKYDRAARVFYKEVLRQYHVLKGNKPKTGKNALRISHNFKNLVKHAYSVMQEEATNEEQRVQKIYRASPMDDFTIEFVVEYESTPTCGYKITDCWGGKGVVVKIVPKEDMPVDAAGNRAHIVMDAGATVSRQNLGRLYEQAYNAASRDLVKEFCDLFGVAYPDIHGQKLTLADKMRVEEAFKNHHTDSRANHAWDRFLSYIEIINMEMAEFYYDVARKGKRAEHMISLLEDGIYLFHPSNNDRELPDAVDAIMKDYMPHMSRVTYRGNSGRMVTTKEPILIGECYFILLEKTGDDWTSVSSGKLQNFGILSHINNQDKHASPWRQQAIRAWGETETAIGTSYMGWLPMAEIIDRNNNIASHRMGVYTILRADKPTNIPVLVDRNKIPLGNAKPLELTKHLALCNGWEFAYHPYQELEPKPSALTFV
ncbi:putative DNA-directed RNA polymerase subunit beta [Ralstonia phage RP12]|uniref:DNA-directed RNA polymerase n=1 Tax=Ralstonia phage RP12 TaxID=1923889 RepID=A0A1L7N185_9CAUD|nr:RNA polymerase beta subunit [Ralstonia phage RP12]BAW19249.1 putative DNA-directed RNA polymerase subunit beta [Ralstonia phage RP12]